MSDGPSFDLEPAREAPVPTGLKRTRRTRSRPRRDRAAAEAPPTTKSARFLGWLVAPRFYYGVGFLLAVGMLLARCNPSWGTVTAAWPHEALGLGGAFAWDLATARTLALALFALVLLIATFRRPGRGRGVLVAACGALVLAAFDAGAHLAVLAGLTLTGGALLAPRGSRRGAVLLVGLAFLAAHLFLPWSAERFTRGISLAPDYVATAFDTIDAIAAPKAGVVEAKGWPGHLLDLLEPVVALLLAGVGLLALLGLGGRWARWAGGFLLVLLCLGTLGRTYGLGAHGAEATFEAGAGALAGAWFALSAAYVLCLTAVVVDLLAARDAR